jgi:hypothetical protein
VSVGAAGRTNFLKRGQCSTSSDAKCKCSGPRVDACRVWRCQRCVPLQSTSRQQLVDESECGVQRVDEGDDERMVNTKTTLNRKGVDTCFPHNIDHTHTYTHAHTICSYARVHTCCAHNIDYTHTHTHTHTHHTHDLLIREGSHVLSTHNIIDHTRPHSMTHT